MMSGTVTRAARRGEQAAAEPVHHSLLAELGLDLCGHLATAATATCHHVLNLKEANFYQQYKQTNQIIVIDKEDECIAYPTRCAAMTTP